MPNIVQPSHSDTESSNALRTTQDSGILLTAVWMVSCSFADEGHDAILHGQVDDDVGEVVDVEVSPNFWFSDDRAAIVQLTVRVAPRKTPTFVAEVTYAAQYTILDETPVMTISEFAWGNGLANLVPFVRAKLAHLTNESRYPTFYLQPVNLTTLQRPAVERAPEAGASHADTESEPELLRE
jgi:preprotein translocase subunit SecB